MPNAFKPVLLIWLLASTVAARCSFAQIAPSRDDAPIASTPATQGASPSPAYARIAPQTVIRGWSLGSETGTENLSQGDSVHLEAGYPGLVIFFNAMPASGAVEYRYRLLDLDPDWTVTSSHLAHYRRLPPGRYRFEVQAHTPGQPWADTTAQLRIEQQPFFYQTWYFYLLVSLAVVAVAAQLLSQRDQLLKGQMGIVLEERNRIASDCHDTLMAGFAAISWQLEATAKLFRDAGDGESPPAKSCDLARSMVAHCQAEARRIIWDLRDSDQLTNILSEALSRAVNGHKLRESVETSFEVQGEEIPIAPGAVHHLVCIGQEAVNNALRHADASNIRISLRYGSEALSLSVRDDGQGFQISSASTRTGHFGIPVMEERARKLGGTLRLTSSADTGTEVAVTVSFQSVHLPGKEQHNVVPWIGV